MPARILLGLETALTVPFFFVSWFACAVWYAIKAGHAMATADSKDKAEILGGFVKHERVGDGQ